MLKIRLQRFGKKRAPIFRIVVIEKAKRRDGKPAEVLGFYNPKTKELFLNKERAEYWKSVGAICSETAAALLKKEVTHDLATGPAKFVAKSRKEKEEAKSARPTRPSKKKREKDKAAAEKPAEETPAAEAPAEEKPAEEAPAAEAKEEAAAS